MLYKSEFDKLSTVLTKQPNIINSLRDDGYDERTLMIYAARNRRKDCVKFLSKKPHDVSVVNKYGLNVLHHIVWLNNAIELLKCLDVSQLNNNIINQQSKYKRTPLHYAAKYNKHKTIRWLLEHGANISLKDDNGDRPHEDEDCDEETRRIILQYNK